MEQVHFTYRLDPDFSALKQGDVLRKSPELNELLEKYHIHYTNSDYTYFQVLTQSCDLVRRGANKKCSARYITLAAVRNLDKVIDRAISEEADKRIELDGTLYCSEKHKDRLGYFLSNLFNNNAKEYFFLKSCSKFDLLDDSCTFLYLSIAIKANDHYDLCLKAKALELSENFQSKLGWTVGNLYSRVGTEDYVPGALPDKMAFQSLIDETLESYIAWVPGNAFTEFKQAAKPELTFDQIMEVAKAKIEVRNKSKVISFMLKLKQAGQLTPEQEKNLTIFFNSSKGRESLKI